MSSRSGTPHPLSPDVRTLVLLRHGKSAYPPGSTTTTARWPRGGTARPRWPVIGSREPAPRSTHPDLFHRGPHPADPEATGLLTPTVLVDFTSAIYEAYPEELLELVTAADPPTARCCWSVMHREFRCWPSSWPDRGRTRQRWSDGAQVSDLGDRGARLQRRVGRCRRGNRAVWSTSSYPG